MDRDRDLAPSPFPDDDGQADPVVRAALARAARPTEPADYLRGVAALCTARLLVPVVATATRRGVTAGGLTSESEAEMAVVMLQTDDGRRALLSFTGLDALSAWRADARPVPVTLDRAAQTARAEDVGAVLIDLAGPAPFVIDGSVLVELAAGHRLVETGPGEFGWAMPAEPE